MTGANIHASAIVDPAAEIHETAEIGPWCHVGPGARIAAGARLTSHVVLEGRVSIGERSVVYPFTMIGGPPQHLSDDGAGARVTIGADCVIREQVSIHRGTVRGGGETRIADHVTVMAAAHIGHDCQIADHAIVASNCSLGGHVEIGEHVFLGGLVGVHQFCRIGARAYVGGCAAVAMDVIPYGSVLGNRAALGGLNMVGLKRGGVDKATLKSMLAAYKALFDGPGVFKDRVPQVAEEYKDIPQVLEITDFIQAEPARSIMGPR